MKKENKQRKNTKRTRTKREGKENVGKVKPVTINRAHTNMYTQVHKGDYHNGC